MVIPAATYDDLAALTGVSMTGVSVLRRTPLSGYTRFGLGGPAEALCLISDATAFAAALRLAQTQNLPAVIIGGGSNLIVSDRGFDGLVLHFTGKQMRREDHVLEVEAGALLQDVVDRSIAEGLSGLHTMTGIPGELGGAVYGNAGAYGRSIQEIVEEVRFTDGRAVHVFNNAQCEFAYRESLFKRHKEWVILSVRLRFEAADAAALQAAADEIRTVRDKKYPPTMKCAGSIFKNLYFANLPERAQTAIPAKLVRDGKVPSGWFLEQAGVMGMRVGDIQVATYHGNLIYNDGAGTAADLLTVIVECKRRVREQFGFELEEEVQYVGF